MQYRIEGGNLPVLIVSLNPGEMIVSEAGGRTWSRGQILTETKSGGVGKALGRMFSGESLFLSHYTAQSPAELAFASSFPGRIVARALRAGESLQSRDHRLLPGILCPANHWQQQENGRFYHADAGLHHSGDLPDRNGISGKRQLHTATIYEFIRKR